MFSGPGEDKTIKKSRYGLRELPKAKYTNYGDDDVDEDFSPDVSEYCPSPDLKDSPPINLINAQGSQTPSVISNLSFLLDNVDFVASPNVLFVVNSNLNTPSQVITPHQRSKTYIDLDAAYYPCNTQNENSLSQNGPEFRSSGITATNISSPVSNLGNQNTTVAMILDINQNEDIVIVNEILPINNTEIPNEPSTSTGQSRPLTRKRFRHTNEWQDNKNKKLKNSGKEYQSVRSKKVCQAKQVGAPCTCAKKCFEKFSQDDREEVFNQFWNIGNHEIQWQHILKYVKTEDVKRIKLDRKNNRTQTIKYHFPGKEGELERVCKVFFINTLSISETFVYTALEKAQAGLGMVDKRGVHDNRPRKMEELTEDSILIHIKMFPVKESHYIRKQSKRQYLSEDLSISKMYRIYDKEWFEGYKINNPETKKATKRQYETIFNTRFNYSFFDPKKDRCATCAMYDEADAERKAQLEQNYRTHRQKREQIRVIKEAEKKSADPTNTTVASFDLEKVLNIPQSNVGTFHYKRNYPVYNFTVFNMLSLKGYCYVWHYVIAKRGAIEIGSCLLSFILSEYSRGIRNFSFYSDSCAGQNKNRFIYALYVYCAKKYNIKITHRFFEVGHSQSEGDSMHGCIEKAKHKKIIYTPEQMYLIILNAKVEGKYNMKEMQQSDFLDIKELTVGKNWARDTAGNKILWSKVKEVSASSSKPDSLLYRYDFESEHSIVNTQTNTRTSRGRKSTTNAAAAGTSTESVQLQQAYHQPLAITKGLYNDLMSLCNSEAIPRYYQGFYRSLKCEDEPTGSVSENEDNLGDE